ncbi:MAG: hypothetical protein A2052_03745 [Deltaproteobacteria bacterium GWA2_54_12]|nr:MAG: hypothetical protein A2052_03745 [Deltaproteobacteria bacterium GWA2_54_12]
MHNVSDMIGFFLKYGNWIQAGEAARSTGIYKAAVGGSTQTDISGNFQSATGAAFLEYLTAGPSAFDRLRPYTRRAAFRTALITPAQPLSAALISEGGPAPATKLNNDSAGLAPVKVGGLAVASKEALFTPEGMESITLELRNAVAEATDQEFLGTIADAADVTEAASADPVADFKKLLDGVNLSGFGSLFFIASPGTANILSTKRAATGGPLLFPGVLGGFLLGLPLLMTAPADDTLTLVDASSISTGAEDMEIKTTEHASVYLDDMDSDGPFTLISVFQAEAIALLGIRSFAAKLMRASGAAVLTGCSAAWAGGE